MNTKKIKSFSKNDRKTIIKYIDLVSRHKEYIPKKLQDIIKKSRVLILGCGLGSQIATLATRVGFENFILVDGDVVDVHNLNRQGFGHRHLGNNKAQVLQEAIREINPSAKIQTYPIFLKDETLAKDLINKSDLIINMVDPNEMMYLVNDYAQLMNKPVFFPLNIIWGGYVLIFTQKSASLKEVLRGQKLHNHNFYFRLLENTLPVISEHTQNFYEKMKRRLGKRNYLPQLGTASYLTSSIVVSSMVKWLSDRSVKVSPRAIFLDLWSEIS